MNSSQDDPKPSSWALVIVIVVIVIAIFLVWQFFLADPKSENAEEVVNEQVVIASPLDNVNNSVQEYNNEVALHESTSIDPINTTNTTENILEPAVEIIHQVNNPLLDESDSWVKEKLTSIIWRKELLELLIDENMVRRFVVFVDNFSQGNIAYSYSPFIKPTAKFEVQEVPTSDQSELWAFNESTFKRFSLYVDLFRSVDSDTLVEWYKKLKPLITEAYSELGYPEKEFDEVLQSAITKVLDIEFPKGDNQLIRPSVMFRYQDPDVEALDDADKLMLRIGKDNLLIIKSVLLEINEKITNNDE